MSSRDEQSLRTQLHVFGAVVPPQPEDRLERVTTRAGVLRRRRHAALAAALVLVAGAGWAAVNEGRRPATLTPAAPSVLTLDLHVTPGHPARLDARLRGEGPAGQRFGWQVLWGDGARDRAYGAPSCPPTSPARVDDLRAYSHSYARPGRYDVRVQVTLCGHEQVTETTTVTITR